MPESKYGSHILRNAFKKHHQMEGLSASGDDMDCDCIMTHHVFYKPEMILKEPHVHDFTQLLCFMGTNPMDVRDFGGAEVEICLGEEQEKHLITSPVIITATKGLYHGPLFVKSVPKPIIFLEIMLTRSYKSQTKEEVAKAAAKKNQG